MQPDLTEKTLATERKYTGKIISVDLLDIELPDGRKAKREVIRHGNAVAIVARRPDGKFVFVKQYRKAAEEALIEVIAGGLEPDEDPVEGAKRETAEETGYEVTSIKFLTTIICTPGYCEERIHLYFAELSDAAHAQDQDPDENVYPVVLSEDEVEDGIRSGTIFDSKTLSAWLCWKIARWFGKHGIIFHASAEGYAALPTRRRRTIPDNSPLRKTAIHDRMISHFEIIMKSINGGTT